MMMVNTTTGKFGTTCPHLVSA